MQKEIIKGWCQKECPEGEEGMRLQLVLRALYEANGNGVLPKVTVYRVRIWTGFGKVVAKRILRELTEIGFFRHGPHLSEVVPYDECMLTTSIKQRLVAREESHVSGFFDGEREPLWGRRPASPPTSA